MRRGAPTASPLPATLMIALLAAAIAVMLAPSPATASDLRAAMTDIQRNALKDGCWARYNGNPAKLHPCLEAEAHWRDALIDGCKLRYAGNQKKLRRCVNTSSLPGSGTGFASTGGPDGAKMFERALQYGCDMRYGGDDSRLRDCLAGRKFARQAHSDGCMRLYGDDDHAYARCLGSYREGGLYTAAPEDRAERYYGGYHTPLAPIQRNALQDGCWQRYNGNNRKLEPCLRAEAYWQDALRDGCWARYQGNREKLDRCLDY